jgi:hypothetical protein
MQNIASHPPPYIAQSKREICIRTVSTAANANVSVTYTQLAGMLGLVATGVTTSVFWTTVFRLRKISMWAPVAAAGTPVSVSCTWTENGADFESPPVSQADLSVSFDHPAFVSMIPPRGSLASKWHGSGQTDEICALNYPTGCVIDFHFDFVLSDQGSALAGPTIAGGTAGNLYHKTFNNLVAQIVNAV